MISTQITILVVLVILSGFFSGSETALMSISTIKVKALVKQKRRGSLALQRIKKEPHRLIITILIGNNLINIGSASLATVVSTKLFGSSGIGIATGVMTFMILIFGEITPKTLASQNAEKISLAIARPIEILALILFPIVKAFDILSRLVNRVLGSKPEAELSEDELRAMVRMGVKEGILNREAARIMNNVLKFEGTKVTQIMTPKSEIEMINGEEELKDIINFVVKSPYSRYPVYFKDNDEIIGTLDVDDILKKAKDNKLNTKVRKITKDAYFVPESKEIDDLLSDFEKQKDSMAIVVDEYGEVIGLVTIEDILEEIVGEIFDKSKRSSLNIKKVGEKSIKAKAETSVEEINRALDINLEEKEFNTIAGFVTNRMQRIPRKGEKVRLRNITIEIDKVNRKKIQSVKISKK